VGRAKRPNEDAVLYIMRWIYFYVVF